jgi:hypothetical protein
VAAIENLHEGNLGSHIPSGVGNKPQGPPVIDKAGIGHNVTVSPSVVTFIALTEQLALTFFNSADPTTRYLKCQAPEAPVHHDVQE